MTKKILTIAALALMMAACSNEDTVQQPAPAAADANTMPFRAVISADNTPTRGLSEATDHKSITAKWEVGEQIALIHGATIDVVNIDKVVSGDAIITGQISDFTDGETVSVVYVGHDKNKMTAYKNRVIAAFNTAKAADPTITAIEPQMITDAMTIDTQVGTLATISNGYDYRFTECTLDKTTLGGTDYATFVGVTDPITLNSVYAIWKLTLKTGIGTSATDLSATKLVVKDVYDDGSNITITTITTVTPSGTSGAKDFYVVLPESSSATYYFEATTATGTYSAKHTGISLDAAKFYYSTLTMALEPAASKALTAVTTSEVGWRIGSDGVAYEPWGTLPTGVTAVAMIAKVNSGGGSGLALELSGDPGKGTWAVANSYAAGKAAVGGRTWRLPTKQDWIDMLVGYLEATDPSVGGYGDDNIPYTAFKTQYNAVGGDLQYDYYWSSTEVDADNRAAWHVRLDGSSATIIVSNKGYVNGRYLALLAF